MRMLHALAATAALTAAMPAAAATTTINGAGFRIPLTGTTGTSSSTATSTLAGDVTGLSLTMNELTHSWVGDLSFTLSKGTTSFTFASFQDAGIGSNDNLNGTYTINDSALALLTFVGSPTDPTTDNRIAGTYRPGSSFASAFSGVSALGDWTLSINDDQASDTGNLGSWSLAITTAGGMGGVPEPATWALMILGFGAVGGAMRRRSAGSLATA